MYDLSTVEDLAVEYAVLACLQAAAVVLLSDGRRNKRPRSELKTIEKICGRIVEASTSYGWYRSNIRMTRQLFDILTERIERERRRLNFSLPAANAFVSLRMQITMTPTASIFEVSKAIAIRSINHVLDVLVAMSDILIRYK